MDRRALMQARIAKGSEFALEIDKYNAILSIFHQTHGARRKRVESRPFDPVAGDSGYR